MPDTRLFHQAHSVCGKIGFAPYACPGSEQHGANIAATFSAGCDSVLDTFDRLEVLESTAEALINAKAIGKVASMPNSVIDELKAAFNLS